MRDAQSMLDQLVAFCGERITETDVLDVFGFTAHHTIASLSGALLEENTSSCLQIVGEQAATGKDLQRLLTDLIAWIRTLLVHGIDPESTTRDAAPEVAASLAELSGKVDNDHLLAAMDALTEAEARMRWAPDKKMHFDVAMVKACRAIGSTAISDIIEMLDEGATTPAPRKTGDAPEKRKPQPETPAQTRSGRPEAEVDNKPTTDSAEPSPSLSEAEIWPSALARIQQERPLVAAWAEQAHDLGFNGDTLTLGFAPEEAGSLQSLERPATRDQILEILAQAAGRRITLELVINDQLESQQATQNDPEQGAAGSANQAASELEPEPSGKPGRKSATEKRNTTGKSSKAEAGSDFYEDPLVKEAMQIFAAEIENRS
jgi:DNA polymerase-3 subunit gamma/tau